MHFVNGIERDKTFFVIRAMGFTGQQGGLVSLRLRVSTWLRPSDVPGWMMPTPSRNAGCVRSCSKGGRVAWPSLSELKTNARSTS